MEPLGISDVTPTQRRRGPSDKSNHGNSSGMAYQSMDQQTQQLPITDSSKDGVFKGVEESHTRSVIKGFTWSIVATSTTTVIAWLVTGKLDAAFQIGVFEFFTKLIIYYIHERIWTKIRI